MDWWVGFYQHQLCSDQFTTGFTWVKNRGLLYYPSGHYFSKNHEIRIPIKQSSWLMVRVTIVGEMITAQFGVGLEGLVFLRYISLVLHFLVGPGPHFPLNQPMIGCRVRTFTFKCQLLIYWVVELCFGCEIWTPYYIKYIHQISAVIKRHCFCFLLTLPKTDIAFEHKPSQKEIYFV